LRERRVSGPPWPVRAEAAAEPTRPVTPRSNSNALKAAIVAALNTEPKD
jgi:hypothetical protein